MKKFWKKQIPSFLMALVLLASLVPAASARSSADITYEVDAGDEISLDRRDFDDLFTSDRHTTGDLDYLVFTDYRDLDDYGHLSARNQDRDFVEMNERNLDNIYFHMDRRDIGYPNDCDLSTLSFVADRRARGTLSLDFTLVGEKSGEKVDGTLEIVINSGSGSSSHGGNLKFSVAADDTVSLSARDFRNLFTSDRHTTSSLNYVVFTGYRDLDDYGYLTAENQSGRSVDMNERDLDGVWFHDDYRDIEYTNDCDLETLTFTANRNASGTFQMDVTLVGTKDSEKVNATVEISVGRGGSHSSHGDISYEVAPGDDVALNDRDFRDMFTSDRNTTRDFAYLVFTGYRDLDDYGYFTATNKNGHEVTLGERDLNNLWFYDNKRSIESSSDCALDGLTFVADRRAKDGTLTLDFTLVGTRPSEKVDGTLEIKIGKGSSSSSKKGDINYTVKSNEETAFDARDFERYYDDNCSGTFRYVEFIDSDNLSSREGTMYFSHGYRDEVEFTASSLERYSFYFNDKNYGDYDLDELSFVADRDFTGPVTLNFRAYGTGSRSVDGTVVLATEESSTPTIYGTGADIRYYGTGENSVQIDANDVARYYAKKIPGGQLQYVRINGIPNDGAVIYNYSGKSSYGSNYQMVLSASDCQDHNFVYNPTSTRDYSLSELSFIPSHTNSVASILFTAYGTGGSVTGTIFISSTAKKVSEVYGPTPKNMAVPFPAQQVYTAVNSATGKTLAGIRFLALPDPSVGKLTLGAGSLSLGITLATTLGYNSGTWKMNQVRFVPANGFTGSVELPYAAYDSTGTVFASGVVSLGVVEQVKKFKDVNASTWCYKYVSQLAGNNIISGYKDGTFREKNTLTWGAALKLVMRAAGYPELAPTVKNSPFSGYLAKAKTDGLVSGDINLNKPITRGQVSQLAAKALKLNTYNLPQNKPFTDTNDVYIQALNAAGIIGGYSDGTFKPNNTLTRGHISAIVWRMDQYRK